MLLDTENEMLNPVQINKLIITQITSGKELTDHFKQIIDDFKNSIGGRINDTNITILSNCFNSMKDRLEQKSEEYDIHLCIIKRQSNKIIEQYQNLLDQHKSNIIDCINDKMQDGLINENILNSLNENFMQLLDNHSKDLDAFYNLILVTVADADTVIKKAEYEEFENKFIKETDEILIQNENMFHLPMIRKQIDCALQFADCVSMDDDCVDF